MGVKQWLVPAMLLILVGGKLDRMSPEERAHWRALRVFVEDKEQRKWLRLKTEEQRNEWLKERGLWDKFYANDDMTRDQIVSGDVRLGWSRDMLFMSWGPPFQKLRLTGRAASRSEKFIYRFEVDREGFATSLVGDKTDHRAVDRYQVNVTLDDDVVAEIVELETWE
ncbi:MAG: hypothetical protein KTR31_14125 [Myxococcales bacterium]|nr:hypothetical protein [Myxococcales bacterium]